MSELDQLRQEAEALKNSIKVSTSSFFLQFELLSAV